MFFLFLIELTDCSGSGILVNLDLEPVKSQEDEFNNV